MRGFRKLVFWVCMVGLLANVYVLAFRDDATTLNVVAVVSSALGALSLLWADRRCR